MDAATSDTFTSSCIPFITSALFCSDPDIRSIAVYKQKTHTHVDFTKVRDSERHWHQLDRMQVCTSLQTDNHASTPPLSSFYRPDALPAAKPTASKN